MELKIWFWCVPKQDNNIPVSTHFSNGAHGLCEATASEEATELPEHEVLLFFRLCTDLFCMYGTVFYYKSWCLVSLEIIVYILNHHSHHGEDSDHSSKKTVYDGHSHIGCRNASRFDGSSTNCAEMNTMGAVWSVGTSLIGLRPLWMWRGREWVWKGGDTLRDKAGPKKQRSADRCTVAFGFGSFRGMGCCIAVCLDTVGTLTYSPTVFLHQ